MSSPSRGRRLTRSLVLVSLTGLCFGLGAPPDGFWWLYWVAFAPLVAVVRTDAVTSKKEALLYGEVAGLGIGLVGFPWIAEMLVKFTGVPWVVGFLGLFVFAAWMAVPYAIWSLVLYLGPKRRVLGALWAVTSFIPLQAAWPVLFPYTPILGLAEVPEFIQLAEFGGVPLIETLVLCTSLLIISALRSPFSFFRGGCAAAAACIPLFMFFYGDARMVALESAFRDAPTWVVGIVQPNVPVGPVPARENLARLHGPSIRAEASGAEVIIWPEAGTYPFRLRRPVPDDRELGSGQVRVGFERPVIFGAGTRGSGEAYGYNTLIHMAQDGRIENHYDKMMLVPIGEKIPIVDPNWARELIPWISHLNVGTRQVVFEVQRPAPAVGSVRVGPLICYEDIMADFARKTARRPGGIDIFVNATIDAWYGYSAEPWEHLALARFRTVEHRVPLVRSVSTGVSAVVDHLGRLQAHLPPRPVELDTLADYPAEELVAEIVLPRNTERSPTPYARWGYLYPWVCALVWLVLAMAQRRHLVAQFRGDGVFADPETAG